MLRVYSIYDNEKEVYSNPFFCVATYPDYDKQDVEAKRIFKAQLFDRQNFIYMFPDKFDLCYIGDFDEKDGTFEGGDALPVVVISGEDAIKELQK